MIMAKITDGEIVSSGKAEVGDVYEAYCCPVFGWTIVYIHPDLNPAYNNLWGQCSNPDCPDDSCCPGDDECPYRGISNVMQEDFVEWLAGG